MVPVTPSRRPSVRDMFERRIGTRVSVRSGGETTARRRRAPVRDVQSKSNTESR